MGELGMDWKFDPPDGRKSCITCVLEELRDQLMGNLVDAGVGVKRAKEIADEAVGEACVDIDDSDMEVCSEHMEDAG